MDNLTLKKRVLMLREAIADAYMRMATNRDQRYRRDQEIKIKLWLEKLTQLCEENHATWMQLRMEREI